MRATYDPYRIMSVLKRKPGSKRRDGQWITLTFDKAIDEIISGGDLFGEGHVDGLKSVRALTSADAAKEMEEAVKI